MGKQKLTQASVELLALAAKAIERQDCQRGCKHYRDGQPAYSCKHLSPRDNGTICCYGWAGE